MVMRDGAPTARRHGCGVDLKVEEEKIEMPPFAHAAEPAALHFLNS